MPKKVTKRAKTIRKTTKKPDVAPRAGGGMGGGSSAPVAAASGGPFPPILNVPAGNVGQTVQDMIDFDNARDIHATAQPNGLWTVQRLA